MKDINPTDAQAFITQGGVTVIDVRTPNEYASGHLAGSININVADPAFANNIGAVSKDATCLVYCGGGVRSTRAANEMISQGFKNVHNMTGGITAWKRANLPVEA